MQQSARILSENGVIPLVLRGESIDVSGGQFPITTALRERGG
jgi:hypothetical protein